MLSGELPLFPAEVIDSVPGAVESIIVDLDRDGFNDIVTAHARPGGPAIRISFGSQLGTFARRSALHVTDAAGVAVIDVDRDGDPDLVSTANSIDEATRLFLHINTGVGDFNAPVAISMPSLFGRSVRTGDVTGDGVSDVVVLATQPDAFVIFPGQGNGAFASPISLPVSTYYDSMALVDFNGDRRLDIAAADETGWILVTSQGGGAFSSVRQASISGAFVTNIIPGDFNRDGIDDLLFNDISNALDEQVRLALGNASNAMNAVPVAGTTQAEGLAVGDMNRDGKLDFVVVDLPAQGRVKTFLGAGNGTFSEAAPTIRPTYSIASRLAIGDVDADGRPDIVATDVRSGAVVMGSRAQTDLIACNTGLSTLAVGDFNGDGIDDLLGGNNTSSGRLRLWRGSATAQRPLSTYVDQVSATANPAFGANHLLATDLDGDGDVDAISVSGSTTTSIFFVRNDGTGQFAPVVAHTGYLGSPLDVRVVDWNLDGLRDVVVLTAQFGVLLVTATGPAQFSSPAMTLVAGNAFRSMDVADMNGDGRLDVAVLREGSPSRVEVYYGNSAGAVSGPMIAASFTGLMGDIAIAELDNDGLLDLVVSRPILRLDTTSVSHISTLTQRADGSFAPPTSLPFPNYTATGATTREPDLYARDVDGDGDIDLLVPTNGDTLTASYYGLFLNAGDGTLPEMLAFSGDSAANTLVPGDYNGDHRVDIVVFPSIPAGRVASVSLNLLPRDLTKPRWIAVQFDPATSRSLDVTFDEPLRPSSVQAADLAIIQLPTGQQFTPTRAALDAWGTTVRFQLPSALPDGDYYFSLPAQSLEDRAGNALDVGLIIQGPPIYLLAGDANRDRRVNFDDLLILAANYNQSPRNFGQGDFDYSGTVNFDDLLILAARYNAVLPGNVARTAPPPLSPLSPPGSGRQDDEGGGSEVGVLI